MAALIFFGMIFLFGYIGYKSEAEDRASQKRNEEIRRLNQSLQQSSRPTTSSRITTTSAKPSTTVSTTTRMPVMTTTAHTTQSVTVDKPTHTSLKADSSAIIQMLKNNGVLYLYHFTDRRNLASIKKHGGLYSWNYCSKNGITIPYAGGNDSSRFNDMRYGLQDYVRLSFCDDHPMMWRLQQAGYDLVLLKIKIDAAAFVGTLFSDMNATDSCHHHGASIEDLKRVRFAATKRHYLRRDDEDFKYHQAEIMVKTFIPAKYIVNLNSLVA